MKAKTIRRFFSRETEVEIDIHADADHIFSILTNAAEYPKWNSTIISLQGEIALGKKLKLVSTLDPKRTFKLTVRELEAPRRLAWGDPMGKRTYTLTVKSPDTVTFSMHEKIGGPLFPLFAKMI